MRFLLLFAVAAAALLAPAAARANDEQFAEARAQVETARQLTQQAYNAAKAGDRERGYELARTAYLDHFEHAEVPLRLRDPNLVLDVEFAFAEFRNGIRDGEPVGELRKTQDEILAGLRDVDRTLADKGIAAPLLAFFFSFRILFREGLEAVLADRDPARLAGGRPRHAAIAARSGSASSPRIGATVADVAARDARPRHRAGPARAARGGDRRRSRSSSSSSSRSGSSSQLEQQAPAGVHAGARRVGDRGRERPRLRRARLHRRLPRGLRDRALLPGARDLRGGPRAVGRARRGDRCGRSRTGRLRGARSSASGSRSSSCSSRARPRCCCSRSRSRETRCARSRRPTGSRSRRSTASWARLPVFLAELTGIHPTREGIVVQVALLSVYVAGAALPLRLEAVRPRAPGGGTRMSSASRRDRRRRHVHEGRCGVPGDARAAGARRVPTTHAHDARRRRKVSPTRSRSLLQLVDGRLDRARRVLDDAGDERAARGRRGPRRRGRPRRGSRICGRARKRTQGRGDRSRAGPDARDLARIPRCDRRRRRRHARCTRCSRFAREGCRAVAVSGAFAVDDPDTEQFVVRAGAPPTGCPACAGHELSGAYGLETRTISAAINASILPVVERTTTLVAGRARRGRARRAAARASRRRRRDERRTSSAAGRRSRSAPARQPASPRPCTSSRSADGIVVECGGTSSNVSVIKSGRPLLRTLRVMGRPTCVRSIDSWVVGAAGGSMARVRPAPARGRRPAERPPRRAAVRVLRDARGAGGRRARARARRGPAIPRDYAVDLRGGRRLRAHGDVRRERARPGGWRICGRQPDAARLAFAPLAERLRTTVDEAATRVLDGAARRIADAAAEAAKQHALRDDVPLVALGGAGDALVARVARVARPADGADRNIPRCSRRSAPRSRSCASSSIATASPPWTCPRWRPRPSARASRRAPLRHRHGRDDLRRRRIGSCARSRPAPSRWRPAPSGAEPADDRRRLEAAADALELAPADLTLLAANDFYRVYSENGSGRVAVVDARAAVPVAEDARRVFAGERRRVPRAAARRARASTRASSGSRRCSRASCSSLGSRILDLSDARRPEDVLTAAERALGRARARRRRPRALMSLYRQAGRRSGWLAAAVVVALLVGFGIGFAVSRATAEEPTVEEAVASVQEEAGETADALELVAIHYRTTEAAAGRAASARGGVIRRGAARPPVALDPRGPPTPARRSRGSPPWSTRARRPTKSSVRPRRRAQPSGKRPGCDSLVGMAHAGHSVDEYLETIYFLAFPIGEYRPLTGRSSPTLAVTRRRDARRLARIGRRDAQADRGRRADQRGEHKEAVLTKTGRARAEKVVRKHRLIERLLTDFMDYTRRGGACPRGRDRRHVHRRHGRADGASGSEIPSAARTAGPSIPAFEQAENDELKRRSRSSTTGRRATIVRLAEHDGDLLHWFYDQGFEPGRELRLTAADPAAGSFRVQLNGREETVAEKAAAGLFVRPS